MKTDVSGCSTCPNGQERYEEYAVMNRPVVQYDYRTHDGRLFSCVAKSLELARRKRDEWLKTL